MRRDFFFCLRGSLRRRVMKWQHGCSRGWANDSEIDTRSHVGVGCRCRETESEGRKAREWLCSVEWKRFAWLQSFFKRATKCERAFTPTHPINRPFFKANKFCSAKRNLIIRLSRISLKFLFQPRFFFFSEADINQGKVQARLDRGFIFKIERFENYPRQVCQVGCVFVNSKISDS